VEVDMSSLTPEFFDTLIIVVIIIGLALAVVRLYADFTRHLPNDEDTKENPSIPSRGDGA
jgi:hypothetical protein